MVVYLITNMVNGKQYVGQTIQNPKARWYRHVSTNTYGTAIGSAIEKYGKENFKFEVLDKAESLEELNSKEQYWIAKLNTFGNGYNMGPGGNNQIHTELAREKISKKLKGIKRPHFNKPVIEVTTGKEFESQTEAFKYFGLGRNTVYESIKNGRTTKSGLIFKFKES